MFNPENTEKSRLDQAIDTIFDEMSDLRSDEEDYATMVNQLTKLYALKEPESKKRVSPDTLALVAGNLLGIILIVGHERANVVTSKAMQFVMKAK